MAGTPTDRAVPEPQAARDPTVTLDAERRVVRLNRAAEALFGRRSEEAAGVPVAELVASGDPAGVPDRAHMADLLASAETLAGLGSWERDLRSGRAIWSDEMFRIHGLEPQSVEPTVERLLAIVHPGDRDRIAATLAQVTGRPEDVGEGGITAEYRAVTAGRGLRHVRFHGRVVRDAAGRPVRWIGSAQDVTDERMTERELYARYAVGQALRDWETRDEGAVALLRRLATALDYPISAIWKWDAESERLVCRAFWSAPEVDARDFELVKRDERFAPGEGKVGRAWLEQRPVILPEVPATDGRFRPIQEALDTGLRAGLSFPAMGDDGPLAIVCLYGFESREATPSLIRTLTDIGRDIGRFLDRQGHQLATRRLSDREIEILKLAADGLSGPKIAQALVLSPWTVKTHFENIYEKLGVGDRPSAVAVALRAGLFR